MRIENNQFLRRWTVAIVIGSTSIITACVAPPASAPVVANAQPTAAVSLPRVFFTEPEDGATVASPLRVKMATENFVVETTENGINPGKGHLHIMVDSDCIAVGDGIPKDNTHLHYGKGQLEAELTLASGEHTLCLQAADGAHIALAGEGMTHRINVMVK